MVENFSLPDSFYRLPNIAKTTVTRKQLRQVLLESEGQIMACGKSWNIRSKHIGAGVYKVWLSDWYSDTYGTNKKKRKP